MTAFINRLNSSAFLYAALANAIPLYGVLFLGWDIFVMFFVFWLENVVIGIFMIMAILFYGGKNAAHLWAEAKGLAIGAILGALFMATFFTFHYGMFTGGHGAMIFALFGPEGHDMTLSSEDLYVIVQTIKDNHLGLAVLAMILAELFNQVKTYLNKGKDIKGAGHIMFSPYKRIIVLHVGLIFGGLAAQALGEPVWALIILALLKTAFDLMAAPIKEKSK